MGNSKSTTFEKTPRNSGRPAARSIEEQGVSTKRPR